MTHDTRDSASAEKQPNVRHLDSVNSKLSSDQEDHDPNHGFSAEERKSIIRRLDRRLVVVIGIMYCISLMDRTNMSAANIAGMAEELTLTGYRYNIANLVFFVPYVIFQAPSTVLVRKLGPRLHLGFVTFAWGIVVIGMGFIKNYEGLTGMRALLGVCEAGFFPSAVYLLSTWYTRYEVGKRYSVFYLLGSLASACSGILAYGIMQLNGRESITGWRWIFIIEGALTAALGFAGYWLLIDFPDSTRKSWKFLGDRERAWVVDRIRRDRGDSVVPPFSLGRYLRGGLDWKVWAYAMIFLDTTTITYALAYTLPIILNEQMGFSIGASQCLIAPPYAFAGIVMCVVGYLGDRFHVRGPFIVANMVICLIGLPIAGWAGSSGVRYFGIFLVTAGANSNVPCIMSLQANNVRGQWKRAFASATMVGFGGIGGIAGSLVFRTQDKATGYKPGFYACMTAALLNVVLVALLSLDFRRENAKAERGEKVLEAQDEGSSDDFKYTY